MTHINCYNLNKGLESPATKSPTKGKKWRSTAEVTLHEPSIDCLAFQNHITKEKSMSNEDPQISTGQVIGVAVTVKSEKIKQESKKDELNRYKEILGECKKHHTMAEKNSTATCTSEKGGTTLYTHAHGHVCERKDCDPVIVSQRVIIKPSWPSSGHCHINNIQCNRMMEMIDPTDNTKSTNSTENEAMKSMNDPEPNLQLQHNDKDTTNTPVMKSVNNNDGTNTEQDAANSLLMLQQLAEMDAPVDNNIDEATLPLLPESTDPAQPTNNTNLTLDQEDNKSDDTIIYDIEEYQHLFKVTDLETDKTPVSPKVKGVLTITEVGVRSKPSGSADPVGPVTNEGKLCRNHRKTEERNIIQKPPLKLKQHLKVRKVLTLESTKKLEVPRRPREYEHTGVKIVKRNSILSPT